MIKNKKTPEEFHKINWIIIACFFSLIYWILESIRDAFVLGTGDLFHQLFFPNPMIFWMRMLVIFLLLLFGSYAQSVRIMKKVEEKSVQKDKPDIGIPGAGIGFGIMYWLIQSARSALMSENGNFVQVLLHPDPFELWDRFLAMGILLLFGLYAEVLILRRKQTEKSLKEAEERLYQIISQMPLPIQICDATGETSLVNQAFLTLFQYESFENVVGNLNVFDDPFITQAGLTGPVMAAFKGETITNHEITISSKVRNSIQSSREKIFVVTLFPVRQPSGALWYVVIIWKDLTEQRHNENEKKQIQEQLLHAQKMEAVGMLAGGIAHDFNNLLTAILGSTEMAMLNCNQYDNIHPDLMEIKKAANSAADLTQRLLLFSHKQPMGLKAIPLNILIENLHGMYKRLIGEDIDIQLILDPKVKNVKGDKGTLEQVIMNLVVNARDAMPNGGKLTFRTQLIRIPNANTKSSKDRPSGTYACLSIQDTGSGMNRQVLQHIFEPFFSTKGPRQGTGLGLAVVYGIIQQHKGWIDVKSEPNKGSVFNVYIPSVNSLPPEADQVPDNSKPRLMGQMEKILVIEDDENVRKYVIRALNRHRYKPTGAADGREALKLLNNNGKYDLLLSDVVLPGKNGIELAVEFKEKNPELKVIMSSGYMNEKSQWPLIREKGFRFIQKPYLLTNLLQTIQETLNTD